MSVDEASDEDRLKQLTFEVRVLRRRVRSLEQYGIALIGAATIALLLCGSFVPIFTDTNSSGLPGEEGRAGHTWSLGRIIADRAAGSNEVSGSGDEWTGPISIGFVGLAVLVLLLITVVVPLTTLPPEVVGPMTRRRSTVLRTLVALGGVGSLVPLVLSGMALTGETADAGWGGVLLYRRGRMACLRARGRREA